MFFHTVHKHTFISLSVSMHMTSAPLLAFRLLDDGDAALTAQECLALAPSRLLGRGLPDHVLKMMLHVFFSAL